MLLTADEQLDLHIAALDIGQLPGPFDIEGRRRWQADVAYMQGTTYHQATQLMVRSAAVRFSKRIRLDDPITTAEPDPYDDPRYLEEMERQAMAEQEAENAWLRAAENAMEDCPWWAQ